MAFILKSTKSVHALLRLSYQNTRRNRYQLLRALNAFDFRDFPLRTLATVAPVAEKKVFTGDIDRAALQLHKDILNRNTRVEDVKELFYAIKETGQITYPQLLLLLKCCSEVTFMWSPKERIEFAEEVWKTSEQLGLKFHITHYNALLNAFLENNHVFSPQEFLKILKKDGVEPNIVTYRRLLKCYCQQGDIKGANEVLNQMKSLDYPLCEHDFNSLVQCYSEIGDFEEAANVLKLMQKRDLDPTSATYGFLLRGYAKHGQIDMLKKELSDLPGKDILLLACDALEVAYTLAVNGHSEHVHLVMAHLTDGFGTAKIMNRLIQRLLHNNEDDLAIKFLGMIVESGQSPEDIQPRSKYVLQHHVLYRTPKETLDLCEDFANRGWANVPLGYALSQVSLEKDEDHILDFLEEMKRRGIEIRSHYYWPAIIKASRKGNARMFQILKAMPRNLITGSTLKHIVFPNYNFSRNWQNDLDNFRSLGLPPVRVISFFLRHFIQTEDYATAEKIGSMNHIMYVYPVSSAFLDKLAAPREGKAPDKHFVNILYQLAHDEFISRETEEATGAERDEDEEQGEEREEISEGERRTVVDNTLLKLIKRREVHTPRLQGILEYMKEKGFVITRETASMIRSNREGEEIAKIVDKLSEPGSKFNVDNELLNVKRGKAKGTGVPLQTASWDDLWAQGKEPTQEEILAKLDTIPLRSAVLLLLELVKAKRFEDSMTAVKHLVDRIDPEAFHVSGYSQFVEALLAQGQIDMAEEATFMGFKANLLPRTYYANLIKKLCAVDVKDAIRRYTTYLETNPCHGWVLVLEGLMDQGVEADIHNFAGLMQRYLPKWTISFHLAMEYAARGEKKNARKALEAMAKFRGERFYTHCGVIFPRSPLQRFLNYLELVKPIQDLDRVPLYKIIIRKCAEEQEVEKAKALWTEIEEDDISDFDFLGIVGHFMQNPSLVALQSMAESFTKGSEEMRKSGAHDGAADTAEGSSTGEESSDIPVSKVIETLIDILHNEGFEQMMDYINVNDVNRLGPLGRTLLREGKVDYYWRLVDTFLENGHPVRVMALLHLGQMWHMMDDDRFFQKYKTAAFKAYEDGRRLKALAELTTYCICSRTRLDEAEALVRTYPKVGASNEFSVCLRFLSFTCVRQFCENLLSSETMKVHTQKYLGVVYSKLLAELCRKDQIDEAIGLLKKVVDDGVEKKVSNNVIARLKDKIEEQGKTFPDVHLFDA